MSDLDQLANAARTSPGYRRPVRQRGGDPLITAMGWIAVFAIVIGGAGYLGYRAATGGDEVERPAKATRVSATQLVADYVANEVRADSAYKGPVAVSGTITQIHRDLVGNAYVTLDGGVGVARQVQCFFPSSTESQLVNFSDGEHVVITGRCDGLMVNVIVRGCTMLDTD